MANRLWAATALAVGLTSTAFSTSADPAREAEKAEILEYYGAAAHRFLDLVDRFKHVRTTCEPIPGYEPDFLDVIDGSSTAIDRIVSIQKGGEKDLQKAVEFRDHLEARYRRTERAVTEYARRCGYE